MFKDPIQNHRSEYQAQSQASNYRKNAKNSKISLKSRRQRHIPQIKIQLDQMLSQAFTEMNNQPRKNNILGNEDIYILDNQLLRDYIQGIYNQYGIQDPLAKWENQNSTLGRSRNRSTILNNQSKNSIFQTPQKYGNTRDQTESRIKIQKRQNKTSQRLSKLKKNFQTQLRSSSTCLNQNNQKTVNKKIVLFPNQKNKGQTKQKPKNEIKKTQLKFNSNLQQKQPQLNRDITYNLTATKSYLLTKTKFKYCLSCEQPLQADFISQHQKNCKQLQNLLNKPNLQIDYILEMLQSKIYKIKNQLIQNQKQLTNDTIKMKQLISTQISQRNDILSMQENESEDFEQTNHLKILSLLKTMKCMQNLDKLHWFRKMRAKALLKKTYTPVY